MASEKEILEVLDIALGLRGRSATFNRTTPLLGALPELDSMAVLTVMTMLEERFAITIHDDEIDSAAFVTVGALTDWVAARLSQH